MTFFQQVYLKAKEIPSGKVATYGQIAGLIGSPGAAMQVGFAMAGLNLEDSEVPWWRIINAKGYLSINRGEGIEKDVQADLLRDEGVVVSDKYIVDLDKYLWLPV